MHVSTIHLQYYRNLVWFHLLLICGISAICPTAPPALPLHHAPLDPLCSTLPCQSHPSRVPGVPELGLYFCPSGRCPRRADQASLLIVDALLPLCTAADVGELLFPDDADSAPSRDWMEEASQTSGAVGRGRKTNAVQTLVGNEALPSNGKCDGWAMFIESFVDYYSSPPLSGSNSDTEIGSGDMS